MLFPFQPSTVSIPPMSPWIDFCIRVLLFFSAEPPRNFLSVSGPREFRRRYLVHGVFSFAYYDTDTLIKRRSVLHRAFVFFPFYETRDRLPWIESLLPSALCLTCSLKPRGLTGPDDPAPARLLGNLPSGDVLTVRPLRLLSP